MIVLRSEDLFANVQGVYDQLVAFLDLPDHKLRTTEAANSQGDSEGIRSHTQVRLREFYASFNRQLNEYHGRDFQWGS